VGDLGIMSGATMLGCWSPAATAEDHAAMPGMVPTEEMDALKRVRADAFDARFVTAMTLRHRGAVGMADEALREAGDIRLRLMPEPCSGIRGGQLHLDRLRPRVADPLPERPELAVLIRACSVETFCRDLRIMRLWVRTRRMGSCRCD
jgi:hypothetical protein